MKKANSILLCLLTYLTLNSCGFNNTIFTKSPEKKPLPVFHYEKIPEEFSSLKPTLDNFVAALKSGKSRSKLASFADANVDISSFLSPSEGMKGHLLGDLFVEKIGGFEKIDANALKFRVHFLSLLSKEKKVTNYIAIKQDNESWGFAPQ